MGCAVANALKWRLATKGRYILWQHQLSLWDYHNVVMIISGIPGHIPTMKHQPRSVSTCWLCLFPCDATYSQREIALNLDGTYHANLFKMVAACWWWLRFLSYEKHMNRAQCASACWWWWWGYLYYGKYPLRANDQEAAGEFKVSKELRVHECDSSGSHFLAHHE